jgi:hypothetical protein
MLIHRTLCSCVRISVGKISRNKISGSKGIFVSNFDIHQDCTPPKQFVGYPFPWILSDDLHN